MSAKTTGEHRAGAAAPAAPSDVEPAPTEIASRLGLTGPSGSRRRGAILRRLLATGDVVGIFAALCVATAATQTTDVAKLFWALLFTPAWLLVIKLHGLYDNDHRRIRHSTLDELPQLFNVLRGDMSLVGPRPEEEAVVALYDERQRIRLAVKPGLTGPMQVYGRGDLTFEERLAMERDYLDNLSVAGDLAILLRTPRAIVRGEGAY